MDKHFYFICPTDCLENTINKTFKYENYFYTSLGNSFIFDSETIKYIIQVIEKYDIRDVFFVLSMDNEIVTEALENHQFSNIETLNSFCNEITKQKERSKISFQKGDRQFIVLSYYLNKKIKELELQLTNLSNQPIKISGKIYNRSLNTFINIYSDLVCLESYHLN